MKYDRINEIEKTIKKNGSISNEELCKEFSISLPTLRRDLAILEKKGSVEKVYGGVIAKDNRIDDTFVEYANRKDEAIEEKKQIGKKASHFIDNGDVVFIDSGSTACQIIPYIKNLKDVTIVTHALNVAEMLLAYSNIRCIVLGGQLSNKTNSFETNVEEIPYRFDKAFISTVGASRDGCTNVTLFEARVKQYVLKHSNLKLLLCDKRKFNVEAFNRFAKIEDFNVIISNGNMPQWLVNITKRNHIELIH